MQNINIGNSSLKGSAVALGCMRIENMSKFEVDTLIKTALEEGINFFDHADVYGNGNCERIFGDVLKENPNLRQKMIIQTKCGIRDGYYDFSEEHIIKSVEKSLLRLNTDYIDILLLHRPDALMEPEEVNNAFNNLYDRGLVKHFGVSNQNPMQIELLKKYCEKPLIINQLQLSITNNGIINSGLNVNMLNEESYMHDGSILDYCRINDITIQAWSPFQYGFFEGVFLDNKKFPELNNTLNKIAEEKAVTATSIATAWILRHPGKMQVITGSTNINRIKEICKGAKVNLTRKQWYEIYKSAGHSLP